jgi:hypothetical protein
VIRSATDKTVAIAVLAVALLALALLPGAASASVNCDQVAEPGADAQEFAESLTPGQTGCFRAGNYSFEELKVTTPGVTLAAYPGEAATLSGRVWVARGADGVTFSGLTLDGRNARQLPSPSVNAADTTFDEVDVTSHHASICFKLGDSEYGRAVGTVIENSRIHDCGQFPNTNMQHGIYIGQSDGAVIRDNYIYDNADRGVQVYPDAQNTQIVDNVIDGNGEGIVISGDGTTASSGTVVHQNVISNSTVRWNVESSWPDGVVGSDNQVTDNCTYAGAAASNYYDADGGILPKSEGGEGFVSSGNVVEKPQFVDPAGGDYRLAPGSGCSFTEGAAPAEAPGVIILHPAPHPVTPKRSHRSATVARVRLIGKAIRMRSRTVRIEAWRSGNWGSVSRVHVNSGGRFRVSIRLRVADDRRKLRLRAVAPGVSNSRAVVLHVGG